MRRRIAGKARGGHERREIGVRRRPGVIVFGGALDHGHGFDTASWVMARARAMGKGGCAPMVSIAVAFQSRIVASRGSAAQWMRYRSTAGRGIILGEPAQ